MSKEFGFTVGEIERDGFPIIRRIEMLLSTESGLTIAKTTGQALIDFAQAFSELVPDAIVILGDRYELLAVASAAYLSGIPIAHIAGGEVTEGSLDDGIRHAITKLSYLHFASTEAYRNRIIQMGESPDLVFNVGAIGLDNLDFISYMTKVELEKSLEFKFGARNLVATYHPSIDSKNHCENLLAVLEEQTDIHIIFTGSNQDAGGGELNQLIKKFAQKNAERCVFVQSLGARRYYSTLKFVDGVIGNSSSGISEAPSFQIGTINIGNRQNGRMLADSVINCAPEKSSIRDAIVTLYSPAFKKRFPVKNPYGNGGTAPKILAELIKAFDSVVTPKKFYDIPNFKGVSQ